MADKWDSIRAYARTGSTTAFEAANPGLNTADLQQFQREYPQVTVAGRALARRGGRAGNAGSGASGAPAVQRGDTTGPLQTPEPTPQQPDRGAVGPEPDRLAAPKDTDFVKTFKGKLKKLDDKAVVIPTPAGLGPWILALVFLLFAVVPFNGHTRLQLIWYSLTGAAHVPGFIDNLVNAARGSGGSGGGSGSSGGSGSGSGGQPTSPPPEKPNIPGGFMPRVVGG
jgi:hypothetical protein